MQTNNIFISPLQTDVRKISLSCIYLVYVFYIPIQMNGGVRVFGPANFLWTSL